MAKPLTELSTHVANEVMKIQKVTEELSIFPEKATAEKLRQLDIRVANLIDHANFIVSSASTLEDSINISTKRIDSSVRFISDGVNSRMNK